MSNYISLYRLNSFIILNKNIFKICKSTEYDLNISKYSPFSELYVMYKVEDNKKLIKNIKNELSIKFTNEKKYGDDYFSGNVFEIIKEIENIISKYETLNKIDLFEPFINKKLGLTFVYNNENFNKGVYKYIKMLFDDIEFKYNTYEEYENIYYNYFLLNENYYDEKTKDIYDRVYICSHCCNYVVDYKSKFLMKKHLSKKINVNHIQINIHLKKHIIIL